MRESPLDMRPYPSPHPTPQATALPTQLFYSLVNDWSFQPGPTPASTWIAFQVDFAFRSAMYSHVASIFLDEVIRRMVGAFERRCMQLQQAQAAADAEACFEAAERGVASARHHPATGLAVAAISAGADGRHSGVISPVSSASQPQSRCISGASSASLSLNGDGSRDRGSGAGGARSGSILFDSGTSVLAAAPYRAAFPRPGPAPSLRATTSSETAAVLASPVLRFPLLFDGRRQGGGEAAVLRGSLTQQPQRPPPHSLSVDSRGSNSTGSLGCAASSGRSHGCDHTSSVTGVEPSSSPVVLGGLLRGSQPGPRYVSQADPASHYQKQQQQQSRPFVALAPHSPVSSIDGGGTLGNRLRPSAAEETESSLSSSSSEALAPPPPISNADLPSTSFATARSIISTSANGRAIGSGNPIESEQGRDYGFVRVEEGGLRTGKGRARASSSQESGFIW